MSVEIETEISYASFGNYRKRLANNRFRQELVCIESECGEIYEITKSLSSVAKVNKRTVATIAHTEVDTVESFEEQLRRFPFFKMDFILDGVNYDHYFWMESKLCNDKGSRFIERGERIFLEGTQVFSCDHYRPLVCWVCNRLFMNPTNYVQYQGKWVALNHAPIWCSPACQVKYASFRLARKRKAERHATDKSTTCKQCGLPFIPKRLGSSFCSSNCRLRHHRHTRSRMTHDQ